MRPILGSTAADAAAAGGRRVAPSAKTQATLAINCRADTRLSKRRQPWRRLSPTVGMASNSGTLSVESSGWRRSVWISRASGPAPTGQHARKSAASGNTLHGWRSHRAANATRASGSRLATSMVARHRRFAMQMSVWSTAKCGTGERQRKRGAVHLAVERRATLQRRAHGRGTQLRRRLRPTRRDHRANRRASLRPSGTGRCRRREVQREAEEDGHPARGGSERSQRAGGCSTAAGASVQSSSLRSMPARCAFRMRS